MNGITRRESSYLLRTPMKFGDGPLYRYVCIRAVRCACICARICARTRCAEAKHSAEHSPWHCYKNKRITNAAHPPHLRRGLCFIYDTTEPKVTSLFLSSRGFLKSADDLRGCDASLDVSTEASEYPPHHTRRNRHFDHAI